MNEARRGRQALKARLERGDAAGVTEAAVADRRIARGLIQLLYDEDGQTRDQAAAALGRLAAAAPRKVLPYLDRLWWALNDESGMHCPGAPLAIAHIALAQPDLARGFVVPLVHFLEDEGHLPDVLRAIALLAGTFPEAVADLATRLAPLITHGSPEIRTPAAAALAALRRGGLP